MTVATEIPFERKADWLPDQDGDHVRIGDYVIFTFDSGKSVIGKVSGLHPREAYDVAPGKTNGLLDLAYSYVNIETYAVSSDVMVNVQGATIHSRTVPDFKRAVLDNAERRKLRTRELQICVENCRRAEAYYADLRREFEIDLEALRG